MKSEISFSYFETTWSVLYMTSVTSNDILDGTGLVRQRYTSLSGSVELHVCHSVPGCYTFGPVSVSVSLFNGISTFLGYLKAILLEQ